MIRDEGHGEEGEGGKAKGEEEESDEDDYTIQNHSVLLAMSQRPMHTRSRTRSSEATTMISPLFETLDVEHEPATEVIQAPPSPTLATRAVIQAQPSPTLAIRAAQLSPTLNAGSLPTPPLGPATALTPLPPQSNIEYQPIQQPQFTSFSAFENAVTETRVHSVEDDFDFCLSATSVSAAARGLVNAIKDVKQKQSGVLQSYQVPTVNQTDNHHEDSIEENPANHPDFYSIEPQDATLMNLFSYRVWIFRA